MKKKFYGVAGINGYGVYDSYKGVLKNREYVKSHKVKGFQTYADAESYAYNTYRELQEGQPDFYRIEKINRTNWFFPRQNIYLNPLVQKEVKTDENVRLTQSMVKPFIIGI